jgi:hypothetical protein
VSLGPLPLTGSTPALLPRNGDGDSAGGRAVRDDLRRYVVEVRARRTRRIAQKQERFVDRQLEPLGKDPLRLLDHDPRIQRRLQLLDTLEKGGDFG